MSGVISSELAARRVIRIALAMAAQILMIAPPPLFLELGIDDCVQPAIPRESRRDLIDCSLCFAAFAQEVLGGVARSASTSYAYQARRGTGNG